MNTSLSFSELLEFLEREKNKIIPLMDDYDNGAFDVYERVISFIKAHKI